MGDDRRQAVHVRRAGTMLAGAVTATMLLGGCGGVTAGERAAAVAGVATRFLQVVRDGDTATGCALLAPGTVEALEEQAAQPCARALADAGLPEPGPERRADVYVDQAWVVLSTDTIFLAEFDDGWRVVAAGCRSRGDRPYDCAVEGG